MSFLMSGICSRMALISLSPSSSTGKRCFTSACIKRTACIISSASGGAASALPPGAASTERRLFRLPRRPALNFSSTVAPTTTTNSFRSMSRRSGNTSSNARSAKGLSLPSKPNSILEPVWPSSAFMKFAKSSNFLSSSSDIACSASSVAAIVASASLEALAADSSARPASAWMLPVFLSAWSPWALEVITESAPLAAASSSAFSTSPSSATKLEILDSTAASSSSSADEENDGTSGSLMDSCGAGAAV
mmetsp:Transcript_27013/g.89672  ORF Transcript_27013/g.89672 Transcript_27013/m.89672 type:complete len:249 (-) Transcript_27013:87-833(-)